MGNALRRFSLLAFAVAQQARSLSQVTRAGARWPLPGLLPGAAGLTALCALAVQPVAAQEIIEEVRVTGSRIVRPGLASPTPITSIEQDELEALGPATLMDGLDALPQFLGSATLDDTQNFFGGGYLGAGGQSQLNLRGVGGNRTLVLVGGRRMISTSRSGTFDISMLPQALISRTEVVTGGASAAYGSDAIAGVTNFIIDEEFEGLDVTAQGGISELGDAGNSRLSIGLGRRVGQSGHVVLGLEGFQTDEITSIEDRDWYRSWCNQDFGTDATPRRVRFEECSSRDFTFGGVIPRGPLAGTEFRPDGTPVPFVEGSSLNASAQTGAARGILQGSQVGGSGAQFDREQMQRAGQERASLYLNYKHEFNENLSGSLAGMYGYSHIDNQKVGYMLYSSWAPTFYSGNPFIPASLQEAMTEGDIPSFQINKRVSPRDPLHNGRAPLTTDLQTLSGSLTGTLDNGWNWDFYYQYGESNRDVVMHGFRVDRLYRGVDVVRHPSTGAAVCASTLIQPNDGCVPVNLFGIGNVSPEALAWLHDSMYTDARMTQHATEFVINGELFDGLSAGPVFVAVGANWRKDTIDQISGDALNSPLPPDGEGPITDRGPNGELLYRGLPSVYLDTGAIIDRVGAASFSGGVKVWETFAEAIVPLLAQRPFVERLESSWALRHTDYEHSGEVISWKTGFSWELNDSLRLRWTRSRDMRAGNLSEMFDTTQLYAFMDDPWNPDLAIYHSKQINGGNPAVEPEKADTLTYGFVYQPQWLDGAGMTLDYYDIKIKSQISTIGAQRIVDYCYEENLFCEQITFEPGGKIASVDNTTLNVGAARTRGIDLELSYRAPVTWFGRDDSLSLRLIASRLLESSVTPFDSPKSEQVGVGDRQDTHATLMASYASGPATISWNTRWVSDAQQSLTWAEGVDVDNNRIPSHHLSNLRLNWDFDSLGRGSSLYFSINNIFDRNPGDLRGLNGIYDIIGRNYTLGMRYSL